MPKVIVEVGDRRIVRASPRRDTTLHLEKKGSTNAMGDQQWTPIASCSEYPERGQANEEETEVRHLLRLVSKMIPKAEDEK